MTTRLAPVICVLVIAASWNSALFAQPFGAPNTGNPQVPVEPYQRVIAEWNQLDQQMIETSQRYRQTTDPQQREQVRGQYVQMIAASRQLLTKLRASAVAEYRQYPNQNPEVTRTLMGILSNDVRSDDYNAASEIARILFEHKCSDNALWELGGKAAYCVDDFDSAELLLRKAEEYSAIDDAGRGYLAEMPAMKKKWKVEEAIRAQEGSRNDLPRVRLQTTKGDIILELFENEAPQTVGNFISLVDAKFYDGLTFHRVLAGFMAQAGCPQGNGNGGPGYTIYDECTKENRRNHFSGSLSMAKTALPNTGGSQFFLTFRPTPHLDGKHTVFGRVILGFEVLSRLERVDPSKPSRQEPDRILRATVERRRQHSYEPTKVRAQ